jgi:hypothetical protein
LTESEQHKEGYFYLSQPEKRNNSYQGVDAIPRTPHDASELTTKETYWDDASEKPFQILAQDINLCRDLGFALPHSYYMRRIQENFKWMPYDGGLRATTCAKSGVKIQTSWPAEYDGRIVSEEEYLKIV